MEHDSSCGRGDGRRCHSRCFRPRRQQRPQLHPRVREPCRRGSHHRLHGIPAAGSTAPARRSAAHGRSCTGPSARPAALRERPVLPVQRARAARAARPARTGQPEPRVLPARPEQREQRARPALRPLRPAGNNRCYRSHGRDWCYRSNGATGATGPQGTTGPLAQPAQRSDRRDRSHRSQRLLAARPARPARRARRAPTGATGATGAADRAVPPARPEQQAERPERPGRHRRNWPDRPERPERHSLARCGACTEPRHHWTDVGVEQTVNAVATCPVGKVAYGGGGSINSRVRRAARACRRIQAPTTAHGCTRPT